MHKLPDRSCCAACELSIAKCAYPISGHICPNPFRNIWDGRRNHLSDSYEQFSSSLQDSKAALLIEIQQMDAILRNKHLQ